MFRRTHSQAARFGRLLAGVSFIALGLSAETSVAKADNGRSDFGQSNRCSNFQVASGDKVDHRPFMLEHDSLLVSSSTYDRTQGAVASLSIGSVLPGSATKTANAVANNDYVHVWNNESVDASFGGDIADRDSGRRSVHRAGLPHSDGSDGSSRHKLFLKIGIGSASVR